MVAAVLAVAEAVEREVLWAVVERVAEAAAARVAVLR